MNFYIGSLQKKLVFYIVTPQCRFSIYNPCVYHCELSPTDPNLTHWRLNHNKRTKNTLIKPLNSWDPKIKDWKYDHSDIRPTLNHPYYTSFDMGLIRPNACFEKRIMSPWPAHISILTFTVYIPTNELNIKSYESKECGSVCLHWKENPMISTFLKLQWNS